ncbi:MAG: hypothetical protein J4452_03205 [Candidatus Aenigmarchaeota archaeon]|nr:hypothetical protein [Candidatus Aenigmarchaeota archaeon]
MQKTLSKIEVYVQHCRPSVSDTVYIVAQELGYVFMIHTMNDGQKYSQVTPLKIDNSAGIDTLRWARKGSPGHYWFLPTVGNMLNSRLFTKHKKVEVPPELLDKFLENFDLPHLIKDDGNPGNNLVITGIDVYDTTRDFVEELRQHDLF